MSGDDLIVAGDRCVSRNEQSVLKFAIQIETISEKGDKLKLAKEGFIIYWLKESAKHEVKIILPKLYLERQTSNW